MAPKATKAAASQPEFIVMRALCERWHTRGMTLYTLMQRDPDFPKPVAGAKGVFNLKDVERFERTRTLSVRFNCFIAALEAELNVDEETWARAVTSAKKAIPAWGETYQHQR